MKKKILIAFSIGAILIFVIVLLIVFFLSCGRYEKTVKNELDKINNIYGCNSDNDCKLILYYSCNSYAIHKDVNLTEFYQNLDMKRPKLRPYFSCRAPQEKYRAVCKNNIYVTEELMK